MSERFYSVDVGEGVWVYHLELDEYEAPVQVTGVLVKDGHSMVGPHPVSPDDFVHNVANNGLREATKEEKHWLEQEAPEEEDDIFTWNPPDDLDEVGIPYDEV
ncbi:MAG: hypothetical protein M1379_12870 [Firmicutes bacterium]|nr:hypothetical protein [Bacillota bacterium]